MRALTEQQIRRSFVNCSRGEANGLELPKGFDVLDWAELEMLGWRRCADLDLVTSRSSVRFRDLRAASAMAGGSLGPPTTMSFRLALGH